MKAYLAPIAVIALSVPLANCSTPVIGFGGST